MKHIKTKEELSEEIKKDLVLVDFYATWCGPCQMLAPILEELESEVDNLTIVKIDVDKAPLLAKEHGILSIPVLEIYKKNKLVDKALGYMSKEDLKDLLK
ncbi:MAG: thioredoxin [Mycoplasmatota bacterium]|nr:thioredoxin [Mycoplasmatota bacterium]